MKFIKGILTNIVKGIRSNPIYIFLFFYAIVLLSLSLFRNASADETYYLKETALMAELLSKGKWVGDYGVGLHGFLFKLPVAIVFLIIGKPSVFVATIFTIMLSILSLYLFYRIVRNYFFKEKFAIWATILFSVGFHFIDISVSFNRDIPAVFTVLLFVFLFLRNSKVELIGLSLLLMLDAKEHVFFTVAPLYGIYLFLEFCRDFKKGKVLNRLVDSGKKLFAAYFLPLTWIIVMFTTSFVPVNMFVASILGFTEIGQDWNKGNFSTEVASKNLMAGSEKNIPKLSETTNYSEKCLAQASKKNVDCITLEFLDVILSYIGKILYPRTFSFISIPKIIVLPSIIHAISLFISWWKKKRKEYILPMILLFNTLIIIFRASHGRYLLGASFSYALFFLLFIRDGFKNIAYSRNVLIATTVFVISGLFFESTFLLPKIILEISLLILLWAIWIFRLKEESKLYLIKSVFLGSLIMGMFLTVLAFSFEIGQISSYIKYGYNREARSILEQFSKEEKIWINDFGSGELINVYRENYYNEAEWNWKLAKWIPKRALLRTYSYENTFSFEIGDIEGFHLAINEEKIEKIVLVVSTVQEDFVEHERLDNLKMQEWLKLVEVVELKNKIVYIFEVED
jgi:hypothetical protein